MKKALTIALILSTLAFAYSCKNLIKNRQTTLVTVKIDSAKQVSLDIRPATLPVLAKRYLVRAFSPQSAFAAVPANIRDLRLTVSATDMTAIIQTVTVAGMDAVDFLVDVPNGLQRNFLVEGLDFSGVVQYTGSAVADLNGSPVLITINMVPGAGDVIPPTFAGATSIVNTTVTSMTLSWTAATDNVTPSASIVYLIYRSTTSPVTNFSAPTYTTPAGVTGYTVTGLTAGSTYYFVVRARDVAGNIDTNTAERSTVYPGVYVATSGTDTTAFNCAQASPCATIPFALGLTNANEAAFVSAGTYTVASTITISTNRAIACTGANHSTVINSTLTGGALISASQGVTIDGCTLTIASAGATPFIADNGADIIVNDCMVQGTGFALPTTGVALSGNSVVQNSTITGFGYISSYGVSVTGGSSLISNNTFTGDENAVNISGGTPIVEFNTMANNVSYSVYITGGNATIRNNQINTSNNGISISNTSATITGNTINNNIVYGITVSGSAANPVINNSIYCNTNADMFVSGTITAFDASNNSWDHDSTTVPTGPTIMVPTCTPGIDICNGSTAPTYTPFNAAVTGGCL